MFKSTGRVVSARFYAVAAGLQFLLLTAPVLGKPTQAQIGAIRASCQSDYRANCAGVPTGGSAALACLQSKLANLSPECQKAVNAAGGAPASAEPAPAASAPAAPVTPAPAAAAPATPAPATPGATTAPPAAAAAAPPAEARKKTAAPKFPPMSPSEELMAVREACGPDYRALCADERPGGGRIVACLRANAASLSDGCKAMLMRARR